MNHASAVLGSQALLVAALLPAALTGLATLDWRPSLAIAAVSIAHAIFLGVPLYLLLRWRKVANGITAVVGGSLIGALPVGALLLPAGERWAGSSASVGGVPTMVDGVATQAGWENYFSTVGVFALFGAASGLCFWVFIWWRQRGEA